MRLWPRKRVKSQEQLEKLADKTNVLKGVILDDVSLSLMRFKELSDVLVRSHVLHNCHNLVKFDKVCVQGSVLIENLVKYNNDDFPITFKDTAIALSCASISGMVQEELNNVHVQERLTLKYVLVEKGVGTSIYNLSGPGQIRVLTYCNEIDLDEINCSLSIENRS